MANHPVNRDPYADKTDCRRRAHRRFRPVAMSVFASGAIASREALEYVCGQSKIEPVEVGASGRANIRQTKSLIEELTLRGQDS